MSHRASELDVSGTHLLRRLALIPIAAAAVVSGCSEPLAPTEGPQLRPSPIVVIDNRPQVFNVQLRAIDDPNIIDDPNLRPHGHIQFKLTENVDGTFALAWKGQIFNPAARRSRGGA
ncbi:MAG TPA: hypothetical protein VES88_01060 [Gemmatimonadaceae bacterium]|nr:hypothetical protein [Gemmatimonadaceae bacterium]